MEGRIVKGIAGFYYVYADDGVLYACKARGIFRKQNITPLVGDRVEFIITDDIDKEGSIEEIFPRTNSLIRPAVANVDQAVVFFARNNPSPDMNLIDRLLITMERVGISPLIVFNKADLEPTPGQDFEEEKRGFKEAGYPVYDICVKTGDGIDALKKALEGHTTTLAGPSGAGKSSFINAVCPQAGMETGEVSDRLGRGRHTTRHAQIFVVAPGSFIVDTPGFTSYDIVDLGPEDLSSMYPEFEGFASGCRFSTCSHTHEPGCRVIEAVKNGEIPGYRYERYVRFYEDLKAAKKY